MELNTNKNFYYICILRGINIIITKGYIQLLILIYRKNI